MAGFLLTFIRTGQLTVEEARAHLAGAPLPPDCGKRPIVMAPPTPWEVATMTPETSEEIRRQASRIVAVGAAATPEEIIAARGGICRCGLRRRWIYWGVIMERSQHERPPAPLAPLVAPIAVT